MTGARRALVVACDTYDQEGLSRLRSPRADAAALASVLADPLIGDFRVEVVHNAPSHEVQGHIEELFAESRPEDLLLLHLSCHGLKSESGELFFAARNTRLGRLASTAVSADFVQRCMRASRSRQVVLLLDCCYGGAFGTGVSVRAAGSVDVVGSFPAGRLEGGRGRAVITASNAMEYAFEGETLADDRSAPSVFTAALVRGLSTGEADRDEDGWVSLDELYEYVFDRVRTSTPGQTPTRDVEMQGELYLARSRRRRVQPAPVPPDLLAASHDPNVFTRLGAVSELRARLLGDNLPAAAGAHARLAEMAELDIRYVADAAATALGDARLTLHPLELDLGRADVGDPAPRGRVTLAGPPLARTCALEPSSARIRAQEQGEAIEVWVDTTVAGRVDGTLTVRGPLGGGVVAVHAEVTAAGSGAVGHASGSDAPRPASTTAVTPPAGPPWAAAPARADAAPAAAAVGTDAVPTAPSPAPGPVAEPSVPAGDARRRSRERVALPDALRAGAGPLVTLAGCGVLLWGAFSRFRSQTPLQDQDPAWFRHVLLLAALLVVTAAAALVPRTRWPAGAGLLLGALVASTWDLVTLLTVWFVDLRSAGDGDEGLWLLVAGHAVTLAGGAVLARDVVAPAGGRLGSPVVPRPVLWGLVAAGTAAAVTVLVAASRPDDEPLPWTMTAWAALTAAGLPVVAAFARPARFGACLLLGWVAGAAVTVPRHIQVLYDNGSSDDARAAAGIAVAVLLLLPLAALVLLTSRERADAPAPAG